jgi:phosphoserine phosphatase RsbU/P
MMSKHRPIPLKELLWSLTPITFMGRAMCIGVILWFINWAFVDGQTLLGSGFLKTLVDIGSLLALIPLLYFLIKAGGWLAGRLLWRLRRRLIVTYFLIGALPLTLLAFLMALIGYAVASQYSIGLVSRKLDNYLEESRSVAEALSRDFNRSEVERLSTDAFRQKLQERADTLAVIFPEINLSVRREDGERISVWGVTEAPGPAQDGPMPRPRDAFAFPGWLEQRGSFHGLAVEEGVNRRLWARHVIQGGESSQSTLTLAYPISQALCGNLGKTANLDVHPGLGYITLVMTPNGPQENPSMVPDQEYLQSGDFPIYKPVTDWKTGVEQEREALLLDPSFMTPGHIWRRIQQFRTNSIFGNVVYLVISTLAIVLLFIALAAIISAIVLTRSITRAVHHLYQGTKRIEIGELDHEIPITGQDQLGELTGSFNRMTRSIRELLRVSAQKQRLDQEMKIAAQVQTRLFPRSLPRTEALDFAPGICIPARAVSGDYYDFFEAARERTGVVVADVCGKGVSAALMMANLQANLRGQVQAYHDAYDYKLALAAQTAGSSSSGEFGPATAEIQLPSNSVQRIVARVNQQLASAMIDASYITFFYSEFDERTRILRYTNAGHNPPLLYRKNNASIERLDRGGTVLGLFRDSEYEDVALQLEPGDILVAFTDGLIEAHSPRSEEEFGEDRVVQALREAAHLPAASIEQHILETVRRWTADAEQEDDLTLVIFKVN